MALSGERQTDGFSQLIAQWRQELAGKQPGEYSPKDWKILALLELRRQALTRGQSLDSSHPLGKDRRGFEGLVPLTLSPNSPDNL